MIKVVSALVLLATATGTAADPLVDKVTQTAGTLESVLAHVGSTELPCSDPRLPEILSTLTTLREGLANLQAASVNSNYPDYVRQTSERRFDAIAPITIQAHFAAAGRLMSGGCLDLAEQTYRGVVEGFPGPAWNGYRDRAMLGINDVRDRRSAASASASDGQKAK
jgi:hypothetical protein